MVDSHESMPFDENVGGHTFTEKSRKIIQLAKLQQKNHRKKEKLFLLEGSHSVELGLKTALIEEILLTETAAHRYQEIIFQAQEQGIAFSLINEKAAQKLSQTITSPGVFAIAQEISPPTIDFATCQCLVIVDNIQDPGNLGTLIRLAEAFAVSALIITGNSVDAWNAKVIRASAGSIFHLPIIYRDELPPLIQQLQKEHIKVISTSGYAKYTLSEIQETLSQKVAWIFGNEAHGLEQEIIDLTDLAISIPMYGKAESLNITTAAAICLYASSQAQNTLK